MWRNLQGAGCPTDIVRLIHVPTTATCRGLIILGSTVSGAELEEAEQQGGSRRQWGPRTFVLLQIPPATGTADKEQQVTGDT